MPNINSYSPYCTSKFANNNPFATCESCNQFMSMTSMYQTCKVKYAENTRRYRSIMQVLNESPTYSKQNKELKQLAALSLVKEVNDNCKPEDRENAVNGILQGFSDNTRRYNRIMQAVNSSPQCSRLGADARETIALNYLGQINNSVTDPHQREAAVNGMLQEFSDNTRRYNKIIQAVNSSPQFSGLNAEARETITSSYLNTIYKNVTAPHQREAAVNGVVQGLNSPPQSFNNNQYGQQNPYGMQGLNNQQGRNAYSFGSQTRPNLYGANAFRQTPNNQTPQNFSAPSNNSNTILLKNIETFKSELRFFKTQHCTKINGETRLEYAIRNKDSDSAIYDIAGSLTGIIQYAALMLRSNNGTTPDSVKNEMQEARELIKDMESKLCGCLDIGNIKQINKAIELLSTYDKEVTYDKYPT